jgi:hypothetical protein
MAFSPQPQAAMAMMPQTMPAMSMYSQPAGPLGMMPQGMVQPQPQPMQMMTPYSYAPPVQAVMMPPTSGQSVASRKLLEFSYVDDLATCTGKVLATMAKVFHNRNTALKVCVPTAGLAVGSVIVAIWLLVSVINGSADARRRECVVLVTRSVEIKGQAERYHPTVHVRFADVANAREQIIFRFVKPEEYVVDLEESQRYLRRFPVGTTVPCYELRNGALQLDEGSYTDPWLYVIVVVMFSLASLCCCVWMASGFFACCSPVIEFQE